MLLVAASVAARRERHEREYAPIAYVLTDKALAALDAEPVGVA